MKIKEFLLIIFLLSGVISSCKKSDDKDNTVTNDPRIRTMTESKLSTAFVINDVEGLIYNYDSLSYKTDVTELQPVFTGYGGTLSFQYKKGKNGNWETYSSNDTLNFSSPIPIILKSIAPDSNYTKEYEIDIRVHKYDVEAFTWKKKGTLLVQGTVLSQKAVFYNQKYYFFYRNESRKSYVITSENGNEWKEAGKIDIDDLDWTTLTSMFQPDNLAVQATGSLYVCNLAAKGSISFTPSDATLPENCTLQAPLFTLGDHFWIIAKQDQTYYLCSLAKGTKEYQKVTSLDSNVPVEKITTFVSPSGSTTLGYIFGGKNETNGNGTVWGVDINGNMMQLTSNQPVFPSRIHPMPLFFGNKLYIVGGITSKNNIYTNQFYVSSNSGARWSEDTHKILPENQIGSMAKGSIFQHERNKIMLIGGENEKGFSSNVWEGILNQEILDNIIHNRN